MQGGNVRSRTLTLQTLCTVLFLPGIGWHSGKAAVKQGVKLRALLNLIIKENSVPSGRRQDGMLQVREEVALFKNSEAL